jgi:hypothetical protein
VIVSTHQPFFAPYPGFFVKAQRSDVLVILDEVQFPRKTTWITRNRFKNDQGTLWMTVPVHRKGRGLQKISEVRICREGNWSRKHLAGFRHAYAHAPFFPDHLGFLEGVLSMDRDRIVDINMAIIRYIAELLEIETRIVLMSELPVSGKGIQLVLDICKAVGGTQYLVSRSAEKHYHESRFRSQGIRRISFRDPDLVYPQLWGDFIPRLSTLDLLFNCGPKSREILFSQYRSGATSRE